MMKIIFLAYTSKKYDGHHIKIDRPDLTRKMSCLETWVPRIEEHGHEVIFFDGGYDEIDFDSKNKILHTNVDESYDYHFLEEQGRGSLMIERLKVAIRWVLDNREFDYVFRVDDGTYVNAYVLNEMINEINGCDAVKGPGGGGAGVFLSKLACKKLIEFENKLNIHIEDKALSYFLNTTSELRVKISQLLSFQYVLSEKYFTIHYSNGKRQYTTDTIISYYHEGSPIDRKVILNYNLDCLLPQKCNTWDSDWEKTPIYYSFDRDRYNWEHYGGWARATYPVIAYCPFMKNSIKHLFFYNVNFSTPLEIKVLNDYISSLKQDGTIYFFYENSELNNEVLNYLNLIEQKTSIDIDVEYIKNNKGNFYKLENK